MFANCKLLKKANQWFTLIEILIVITIIGILTVALLPRIQGAQASARNTARKADLNQIATALAAYNGDFGKYPDKLDDVAGGNGYLKSLPKDPANKKVCGWAEGVYFYKTEGDGYVLASYMEKQPGNPNVNNDAADCNSLSPSTSKIATWTENAKYVIKVDN